MSSYSSQSTRIPFGASDHERQTFLYEKYISKRWFSSTQNFKNISFYILHHLEIQKTNFDDLDELIFYDSSSSSSFLSEQTDQSDFALSNFGQKEPEIIDSESSTDYQFKYQMSTSNHESEMLCSENDDEFEAPDFSDENETVIFSQKSAKKRSRRRRSQDEKGRAKSK